MADVCAVSEVVPVTSARTVAYLAQHPLLEQCPQLSRDAAPWPRFVQEAVARGPRAQRGLEPIVSAWVAPRGATTPLHHDRHPNYLCHVVGRKLVYLWPPDTRRSRATRLGRKHVAARRRVHRRRLRAPRGSAAGRRALHSRGLVAPCRRPVTSVSVSVWF